MHPAFWNSVEYISMLVLLPTKMRQEVTQLFKRVRADSVRKVTLEFSATEVIMTVEHPANHYKRVYHVK